MTFRFRTPIIAGFLCLSLGACDSAKTNIVEKDPLTKPGDDHDHGHTGEHGRLLVVSADSPQAQIFSLADNRFIDSFALTQIPSAAYASGGYRYAVLVNRTMDFVAFLDGGVWSEDHVDHLHDYEEAPVLLDYTVSGSRPTHIVKHEGQLAIFYDGDATTNAPASVQVLTDADIQAENAAPPSIEYAVNMHGVAEPRGEFVLASVRRADAETTSANPVLPDQIGVYHGHEDGYESEEIFAESCPDLHGAAQNEGFIAFGCSDGVFVVEDLDGIFSASKIANPTDLAEGLRVGTLYGHEHNPQFIGLASAQGGSLVQWVSVDPEEGEVELIDWQPVADARPSSHSFSFEGEHFLILDTQGYLTILESHIHDGHTHWEYSSRIDITEENPADMQTGQRFSMTIAQNGNYAYIGDPIAQHVVIVDIEAGAIVGDIELDFAPASLVWLGIAEAHDH